MAAIVRPKSIRQPEKELNVQIVPNQQGKSAQRKVMENFLRAGGEDMLKDLLREADLSGTWTFRVVGACTSHGNSQRVVVRPPINSTSFSVQLRLKPGDNRTGTLGGLVVDAAKGMSAHEVYKKLVKTLDQVEQPLNKTMLHAEKVSDESVMALVAINLLTTEQGWTERKVFIGRLAVELDKPPAGDEVPILLDRLEKGGYIESFGQAFRLTQKGHESINSTPEEIANYYRLVEQFTAPVLSPGATRAPTVAPPVDPVSMLLDMQEQFERVQKLGGLLKGNRQRQTDVTKQIQTLNEELERLRVDEQNLIKQVDPDNLEMLALAVRELKTRKET